MIYGLILHLRHFLYDQGWKKVHTAPVPTICVGNLTAGGTGKTPFTEMVLRELLHSDQWAYKNLAVLSRGYKRKSKGFQLVTHEGTARQFGDEPVQMARKFLSVTVAVDKNRVRGCQQLNADLIVLDDAFQYRRLKASLNILLVDYNRPIYQDKLLPWGKLRDLPARVRAADIVVVTKCPAYLTDWDRQEWRRLLKLAPEQQLFFTGIQYGTPEPVFEGADSRYTYAQRLVLVSGIANDAPLRSYLSDTYKLARRISFPDHHRFSRSDIGAISRAIRENPTACVMTTEKDAQRLRDVKPKWVPDTLRQRLFYLPIETCFFSPEEREAFNETLLKGVTGTH